MSALEKVLAFARAYEREEHGKLERVSEYVSRRPKYEDATAAANKQLDDRLAAIASTDWNVKVHSAVAGAGEIDERASHEGGVHHAMAAALVQAHRTGQPRYVGINADDVLSKQPSGAYFRVTPAHGITQVDEDGSETPFASGTVWGAAATFIRAISK